MFEIEFAQIKNNMVNLSDTSLFTLQLNTLLLNVSVANQRSKQKSWKLND